MGTYFKKVRINQVSNVTGFHLKLMSSVIKVYYYLLGMSFWSLKLLRNCATFMGNKAGSGRDYQRA